MSAAIDPAATDWTGVYDALPLDDYIRDPVPGGSLSSTGARKLLPPSCPAKYRWEQDHPVYSQAFDHGHAAHRLLLGEGPELVVVEADTWRTKAARAARDDARAAGHVPVKAADYERIQAMVAALREHPIVAALLDPDHGRPEQTLVWRDAPTGVWRRARLDWLPTVGTRNRLIIPDYKTAESADPDAIGRAVHAYGYHQQGAWYLDGVMGVGLDPDPAFLLIVQEKDPPYLVTVAELDVAALRIGRARNRRALDVYAECVATGTWPGYSDGIELVSLPPWVETREQQEIP